MNPFANLRWKLITLLGAVGLVRPLLSVSGTYEFLGGAAGRIVVTVLIAAIWVGVVVATRRVQNPLATLAAAGGAYGIFTILLQQVMWNFVLGGAPPEAPSSAPVLLISWIAILVINVIWGAFLGLVASGIRRLIPQRRSLRAA